MFRYLRLDFIVKIFYLVSQCAYKPYSVTYSNAILYYFPAPLLLVCF